MEKTTTTTQKKVAEGEKEKESGIYKTVEFRMYCFKVLACSKRFCHDWTNCPFAHPGEKARRRDPRIYHYKGIACPEMKMGMVCPRGSACPYAHNVFEYWLHPNRSLQPLLESSLTASACRYRTQPCNDGPACTRRVCFFAHTLDELRVPSEDAENNAPASLPDEMSDADDVDARFSVSGVEQMIHGVSYDPKNRLPRFPFLAPETGAAQMMARSHSCPAASQQTYYMSSLASSLLSHLPDPDILELEDLAEKPHHIEKALTDLINFENEPPQERLPLACFQLQNLDTSALESGLHWNGGPPRLFVDRSQSMPTAHSYQRSLVGSPSSDMENLSHEFLESVVISSNQMKPRSSPFFLANQTLHF